MVTTDDQVCVALLDDVLVRQVLATRDEDDIAMLLRLNLAACGLTDRSRRRFLATRANARPSPTVVGPTPVSNPGVQCRSQRPSNSTV